jgi:uncharacterized Zn finger protein (UPF0148 family)
MKNTEYCKCPFCKSTVEIDVKFAAKNGRIFCGGCCKAFNIKIEEEVETEEEISVPNEESDSWDWGDDF